MANSAYLISPDFEEKISLELNTKDNYLKLQIPELKVYNLIIIGGKGIKKRR